MAPAITRTITHGAALSAVLAGSLALAPAAFAATRGAAWQLDETSGKTAADSIGSNDGTITGSGVKLGLPGKSGTAYEFTGKGGRIVVKSSSDLVPGSTSFTFGVSIKTSKVPSGDYDLIRKGLEASSGGDYKLEIIKSGSKGLAYCYVKGSKGSGSVTGSKNLADGKWHTLSCKKSKSSLKLTVDGSSSSKSVSVGSITNTEVLTIGAKDNGQDSTKGLLDEAKVSIG